MLELTILMVEADEVEAMDLKQSIESFGYKISGVVTTGDEAIVATVKTNPDLILMDVNLQGKHDDISAAEIIENLLNVPIIYLTDNSEEEAVAKTKLTGYNYLIKSFTPSELKQSIEYTVFDHDMDINLKRDMADFKNIFDKAPLGIFHSTVEGKLLLVNSVYSKIYGYDSTEEMMCEVNKSTIQDIFYVEPELHKTQVLEVLKDDEWHIYKNQYYRRNRSMIDVELSFRAVKNKNDEVLYLEGFVKDISEKKKTEAILKETESLYNIISENTGDTIWIMDLESMTFNYVSPSVYELRGYTPEEVLNQKVEDVMTPEAYRYIKENLPKRLERFLDGKEEWKVTRSEVDQYCKDNSIVSTEVVTSLLVDYEGKVSEILGVSRDITERKKIEKNLIESEERNRLLIESAGMGIVYYDTDGTVLMINKIGASYLSGKPEDFVGTSVKDITNPEYAEKLEKRISKAAKSKDSHVYEDHLNIQNDERWFIFTFTRIENSDGEVAGVQMVANDITTVKKTKRERDRFFNLSSNLLCITDFNGLFKQLNPAWEELLGWSENELLSKPIYEFIHPKDRSKTPDFKDFLGEKDSNIKFENRFRIRQGNYKWLSWSVSLLHHEGIIFADVRDVTKQKLSEEALMESEKKYRTLFEYDPDYTILFNKDGIIVDVNNATTVITGFPKKQVIGKSLHEIKIFFKEDITNLQERFSQILKNRENQNFETEMVDKWE